MGSLCWLTDDVCELSDVVSEYLMFCEECVIPRKTVKIYANNKPWVTNKIKHILNMKKKAFLKQDKDEMKRVQRELKAEIRRGKEEYKGKIEDNFKCNNMKKVSEGTHLISGHKGKGEGVSGMNTKTSEGADALNDFYARSDCHDSSEARNNLTDRLTSTPAEERGECILLQWTKFSNSSKERIQIRQRGRTELNRAF